MDRKPAVSGRFYPSDANTLRREAGPWLQPSKVTAPGRAMGVVCPHAGYIYSGAIAGLTLAKIKIPKRVLVLGPNHTGVGARAAINGSGTWSTPLGSVPIATDLARRLMELDGHLEEDSQAHAGEHSLEVQLPLLQLLRPDVEIVPLCLAYLSLPECRRLGEAIASLLQEQEDPPLILASSDMNHYESQESTLKKDEMAIAAILELNAEGLYRVVQEENISMCGVIPTTCMLIAARTLGAKEGVLVKHATSGDTNGDYSGVVGYAGILIR